MKITVLVDNISLNDLRAEWGLSLYIEHNGRTILLDTGTTNAFALNAADLGIDLARVDTAVLSHAHYDHSDGIDAFFRINQSAPFYLREGSAENCYSLKETGMTYIGIKKGYLQTYADRILYAHGDTDLGDGIYLIPHKTPGLEKIAAPLGLRVLRNNRYIPDDFSHEQSLVIRTDKGLVVFNSCSHGGADHIADEVLRTFPNEKIYALIGGLHLFMTPEDQIRQYAARLQTSGIEKIVTGHCTGDQPYTLLRQSLGNKIRQMYSGMTIEL